MMLLASCFCLHRHDAVCIKVALPEAVLCVGRSHVALFDAASMVKVLQIPSPSPKGKLRNSDVDLKAQDLKLKPSKRLLFAFLMQLLLFSCVKRFQPDASSSGCIKKGRRVICKMDGRVLGSTQFGLLAQVLFEGDGAGAFLRD